MVDLVDRAVVIGGLDHWAFPHGKWVSLDDARLRRSLLPRLKALDPDLELAKSDYFRKPPECDARDPSPFAGIRALEFPKWFVCQGCHRLARANDQFELHKGRYRHQCANNKHSARCPSASLRPAPGASDRLPLASVRASRAQGGQVRTSRAAPRRGCHWRPRSHPRPLPELRSVPAHVDGTSAAVPLRWR